ncbi:MAG: dynamin family protein [Candidatus Promineifilaceae bacterium]|nr:dynamin family protein [Candidatus Promineifilaceae bacterium]
MESVLSQEQEALLKRTRETLGRLRDTLAVTGASKGDRLALADSIRQLDELFLLVVAGEFNSGKSAFINALLGQPLLKEGVTPTTSQIFLLKYGSESGQMPGEKGVWHQTAPVELLKTVNIVDTPGTNAIQREHEALTAEFIPRSDLVLFLTSADRPFTESERAFLTQIRDWGKKIVLVVNKIDILANEAAVEEVVEFAGAAANKLVGEIQAVFAVSARLAQTAKGGEPRAWPESGFEPLENYIHDTLDDEQRFKLKLLNPLGVGLRLARKRLNLVEDDLASLEADAQLLMDIHDQMVYFNQDMRRNFEARLGEIDNVLLAMEKRGREFFDETIRLGRIPDLVRANRVKTDYQEQVVADTPEKIEARIGELIDWMVEQDLRQWSAVADHLARRKDTHEERLIGESGPREGTLAYDRQRLIDSIGTATRQAIASYDKEREANALAESARSAVAGTALLEIGGLGIGAAVAALATATWLDVTGILAGVAFMALGFLVLPAQRRKANQELENKLGELRRRLVGGLTDQFERELRRSAQRIEDIVAPYDRFVRAESDRLKAQQLELNELEAHLVGLQNQLQQQDGQR